MVSGAYTNPLSTDRSPTKLPRADADAQHQSDETTDQRLHKVNSFKRSSDETPNKKDSALALSVAHCLVSHQLPTVKHHRQAKVLHRRVAARQGRVR